MQTAAAILNAALDKLSMAESVVLAAAQCGEIATALVSGAAGTARTTLQLIMGKAAALAEAQ